jgi:hypothetical protein
MSCGNGSSRAQHPVELFGDDWLDFSNIKTDPANKSKDTQS